MKNEQTIVLIIILAVVAYLIYLSVRHFLQKGRLFNNAFLYVDPEEREKLGKKPYYIQTAVVLLLLALGLLSSAFNLMFDIHIFEILSYVMFGGALVFSIASTMLINKMKDSDS